MSTFVLLTLTGLGLGALYFLIASGLSLIFGLMGVLNFAHGAFLSVGAYAIWFSRADAREPVDLAAVLLAPRRDRRHHGLPALVELVLIRPLYARHIEQVLVTVGLALGVRRSSRPSGAPTHESSPPRWLGDDDLVLGANIPNDRYRDRHGRAACSAGCWRS